MKSKERDSFQMGGLKKRVTLNIRMDKELFESLQFVSSNFNVSRSEVVRVLIKAAHKRLKGIE